MAERLGIPFYVLNFQEEFGRIIEYFVAEYTAGRTPNPCIVCNTWLKFGKLLEYADSIGAEPIATGHYARAAAGRRRPTGPLPRPRSGQGPVLRALGNRRRVLPRLSFPVGEYQKGEIRRMAAELGLGVADKPDSQEICFVPDRRPRPLRSPIPRRRRYRRRDRHHRRRGGRAAPGAGAIHHRPAQGAGHCLGRAPLRGAPGARHAPRGGGDEGGVGPPRADGQRGQLAGEPSPPLRGENPLSQPAPWRPAWICCPATASPSTSTSPAWGLRRGRRRSATRATACWAAAGSTSPI